MNALYAYLPLFTAFRGHVCDLSDNFTNIGSSGIQLQIEYRLHRQSVAMIVVFCIHMQKMHVLVYDQLAHFVAQA